MSRRWISGAVGVAVLAAVAMLSALAVTAAGMDSFPSGGDGAAAGKCRKCGAETRTDKKCRVCGGSGECASCEGVGKRYSAFSKSYLKCMTCKATGACRSCGGTGGVPATLCQDCSAAGRPQEQPFVRPENPPPQPPPTEPVAEEPAPPASWVDQNELSEAVSQYTTRITALKTLLAEGKTQDAVFDDVMAKIDTYKDRVLRSDVLLLEGHPRQVRVAGNAQSARSGGRTMSPISMKVGKKARTLALEAGHGAKTVVTYGVLSSDQIILLDIGGPE